MALRSCRTIEIALTAASLTTIVQWFSFWAVVCIFLGLVAERVTGETSACLVPMINDWNVWLDVSLQQRTTPCGA